MTPAARLREYASLLSRSGHPIRATLNAACDAMLSAADELDRLTALAEARVQPVSGGPQAATEPPWGWADKREM